MYSRILLPIDLAHESSWVKAAPVAARLAEAFGARLHVLAIVPDISGTYVGAYLPADFAAEARKKAGTELSTLVGRLFPGKSDVVVHVDAGVVYETILRQSERLGCDLIVMASHRPELQDYLIGPNASRVVRHAPCSVHVVRG
jgi:universal stress protein F